ncbi:tetratricopeptide repeat protein [Anoxybacillus vitaminiphilus]|uniref:Tetratricopeptide repeat protein n=1 Tax=Paranoxybacillus vitaminiphilus TaxID=581036 RepID=A0A327YK85_9BACL|nr:tetratricopeptide repeat protein [Anoxybacillus vitaminiphilus]RAK21353.1 tetratricopeptide repeat protein [Anoxybacillus vitaminiphilus]
MDKQKGKIIYFPKLKERLVEKGLERLQAKKYKEALSFLQEAYELDSTDADVELGIVLCLLELGEMVQAKERCYKILQEGKGDYFQILQIYLSILIHLQQYDEVMMTIRAVLEESDNIAPAFRQNLINLLHFSTKMSEQPSIDLKREETTQLTQLAQLLLQSDHPTEHIKIIKQLEKEDIHSVLPILKQYLADEKNNPLTKTMILQLLTSKRIAERIVVKKFGDALTVIPSELNENRQSDLASEVLYILEKQLSMESPSLYQLAESIWLRYLYILYPFIPESQESRQWAAVLHITACEYQGLKINKKNIAKLYGVSYEQIQPLYQSIWEIEEISLF